MAAAANLGVIPTVVIIAVILTVIIWLVRFVSSIKKTNDFYKSRIADQRKEANNDADPAMDDDNESMQN